MSQYIKMVKEFTEAMGQPVGKNINERTEAAHKLMRLRMRLIREEFEELYNEVEKLGYKQFSPYEDGDGSKDIMENLLKELCDLQYVVSGFAVTYGLPFDEAFTLVHKSNMSKLGADGKPIYREDGKVVKGPNYKKPDLSTLINDYAKKQGN